MYIYILLVVLLGLNNCKHVTINRELENLTEQVEARTDYKPEWVASNIQHSSSESNNISYIQNRMALKSGISKTEAVKIALDNNESIQARLKDLATAKADFAQANLFSNPYASYEYFQAAGPRGTLGYEVILLFALSDYVHVPLRSRVFFKRLQQTSYEVLQDILNIVQEIENAYAEVVYYERLFNHTSNLLSTFEKITDKLNSNKQFKPFLFKIHKNIFSLQKDKLEYFIKLKIARLSFKRILGLPAFMTKGIQLTDKLEMEVPDLPKTRELLTKAYNYRPDLKALEKQITYYEYSIDLERAYVLRNLNAGIDLLKFGAPLEPNPLFSTLGIPIFDQNIAQIDKTKFMLEKSKQLLIQLKNRIKQEVLEQVLILKGLRLQTVYYQKRIPGINLNMELMVGIVKKMGQTKKINQLNDHLVDLLEEKLLLDEANALILKNHLSIANALTNLERALGTKLSAKISPTAPEISVKKLTNKTNKFK